MFAGGQIALQRHRIADVIEQVGNGDADGDCPNVSPAVGSHREWEKVEAAGVVKYVDRLADGYGQSPPDANEA